MPTTLLARRDIAFNESEFLAKESEEALLYRDMQSDLVRQIVNRLQGIKPAQKMQVRTMPLAVCWRVRSAPVPASDLCGCK